MLGVIKSLNLSFLRGIQKLLECCLLSLAFQIVYCWKETGYVSLVTALDAITAVMKKMLAANDDLLIMHAG